MYVPINYSLIEISNQYIVMHPRYKLDYFKHNGWQSGWIEEVQDLARSHYTSYYKPSAAEEASALAEVCIYAAIS